MCDGKLTERRVKRVASSELEKRGGFAIWKDKTFPIRPDQVNKRDGIYEMNWDGKYMFLIGYRPFKTSDPGFFSRMALPDVLNLQSVPFRVHELPDVEPKLVRDVLYLPATKEIGNFPVCTSVRDVSVIFRTKLPVNIRERNGKIEVEFNSSHVRSNPINARPYHESKYSFVVRYPRTTEGLMSIIRETLCDISLKMVTLEGDYCAAFFPFFCLEADHRIVPFVGTEIREEKILLSSPLLSTHKMSEAKSYYMESSFPCVEDPSESQIAEILKSRPMPLADLVSTVRLPKEVVRSIVEINHRLHRGICYHDKVTTVRAWRIKDKPEAHVGLLSEPRLEVVSQPKSQDVLLVRDSPVVSEIVGPYENSVSVGVRINSTGEEIVVSGGNDPRENLLGVKLDSSFQEMNFKNQLTVEPEESFRVTDPPVRNSPGRVIERVCVIEGDPACSFAFSTLDGLKS